jgi:histidinol-phosphate aminotransferase
MRDLSRFVRPVVLASKKYNLDRFKLRREEFLEMDANENPFPPTPGVLRAMTEITPRLNRYPLLGCPELTDKIASFVSLKANNVLVSDGSMRLIDLVMSTFIDQADEAILPLPTYTPYETRLISRGGKPVYVDPKPNFKWDIEGIRNAATSRTKLIIIVSPNNPSGAAISEPELKEILNEGYITVVDEAYFLFGDHDFGHLVPQQRNLIIARTFSKAFGLAGLRVGYAISSEELIHYMLEMNVGWVDRITSRIAEVALDDSVYVKENVRRIVEGRKYLFDELSRIDGLRPFPSQSNGILIRIEADFTGPEIMNTLRDKHHILVREMTNVTGLDDKYFRITVGTMQENMQTIAAVKEFVRAKRMTSTATQTVQSR